MSPEITYICLGIAPNAEGVVMQPMVFDGLRGRSFFSFIIAFPDIDSRLMGSIVLTGLKAYYPVIRTLAAYLIPEPTPLTIHIPDHSGKRRDLHLRIHVIEDTQTLLMRRFDNARATGDAACQVMLNPLMDLGPEALSDYVGATIIGELAAMHPGVFPQVPGRMGKTSG